MIALPLLLQLLLFRINRQLPLLQLLMVAPHLLPVALPAKKSTPCWQETHAKLEDEEFNKSGKSIDGEGPSPGV